MRRTFIFCLLVFIILGAVSSNAAVPLFIDVPANHWAYRSIDRAYRDGVISGSFADPVSGARYFSPDLVLTQEQFVTILGRAFFKDEMDAWTKTAVRWQEPAERLTAKYQLLSGLGTGQAADQVLNRYEMAMILGNLLKRLPVEWPAAATLAGQRSKIADYEQIPAEFRKSVEALFGLKVLSGIDSRGTFAGEKYATRAEATIIYHKLKKLLQLQAGEEMPEIWDDLIPQGAFAEPDEAAFKEEMLRLVNAERAKYGLAPVALHSGLTGAAQLRSQELVQQFSHTRPNGQKSFSAAKEAGVNYFWIGENIASGYATPQAVLEAWLNSDGHRKNILAPEANSLGIGYTKAEDGSGYYWAQFLAGIR